MCTETLCSAPAGHHSIPFSCAHLKMCMQMTTRWCLCQNEACARFQHHKKHVSHTTDRFRWTVSSLERLPSCVDQNCVKILAGSRSLSSLCPDCRRFCRLHSLPVPEATEPSYPRRQC